MKNNKKYMMKLPIYNWQVKIFTNEGAVSNLLMYIEKNCLYYICWYDDLFASKISKNEKYFNIAKHALVSSDTDLGQELGIYLRGAKNSDENKIITGLKRLPISNIHGHTLLWSKEKNKN